MKKSLGGQKKPSIVNKPKENFSYYRTIKTDIFGDLYDAIPKTMELRLTVAKTMDRY